MKKLIIFLILFLGIVYSNTNNITNIIQSNSVELYEANLSIMTPFKGLFLEYNYAKKLLDQNNFYMGRYKKLVDEMKIKDELLAIRESIIKNKDKEILLLNELVSWKDKEINLYKDIYKEYTKTIRRRNFERVVWFLGGCVVTTGVVVGSVKIIEKVVE